MIRESFNDNWTFKKGIDGLFAQPGDVQHVTLPHDAMIFELRDPQTPNSNGTGFYPGGSYTYTKTCRFTEADAERDIQFEFEGVYMNATVYINGDLAGSRPYGYSQFLVKANDFLRFGQDNEIKVIVRTGDMPNSRWYSGSGIYRNVKMLKADRLHVLPDGVRVTVKSGDGVFAVVEAAVTMENRHACRRAVRLETRIFDADGNLAVSDSSPVTLFPGDVLTARQRLDIHHPRLWDTESPHLYTCSCRLVDTMESVESVESAEQVDPVVDEAVVSFGVRTLTLDAERGLRINGKTIKLRGSCIHHDNGVIGACTFERAEERRAETLKAAGFNAIRSAHHPMSRAMLDACDRLGLLVMDEAFDVWQASKADYDYSNVFGEWWERDLEAMVDKDYNHPCVILYSTGNEIFEIGSAKGAALGRRLAEKLRALDSTRPVTNCVNAFLSAFPYMDQIQGELAQEKAVAEAALGQIEPAAEINQFMMNIFGMQEQIAGSRRIREILEESYASVDVAGYNYMVSLYEKDHTHFPNRVIVGSETCPPDIGVIWPKVKANGHVIGDFTWVGWDYIGEAGCGAFSYEQAGGFFKPYPALLAFSGDIDITGHRRPMSHYREAVFGLAQAPFIAVQRVDRHGQQVFKSQWCGNDTVSSWTWPGYEGKPAVVEVYSDAQEVELRLNGRSIGRKPAGEAHLFTAIFETTYAPGTLEAVAWSDGRETGRMLLRTAEDASRLMVETDRAVLKADGADLAYLMISVADANGTVNMSKPLPVTIRIEGAGVLQGFGSADPYGTENYFDATKTTYDGRVLAVVRTTRTPGEIRVVASAPGCGEQTVLLVARQQMSPSPACGAAEGCPRLACDIPGTRNP